MTIAVHRCYSVVICTAALCDTSTVPVRMCVCFVGRWGVAVGVPSGRVLARSALHYAFVVNASLCNVAQTVCSLRS